ncbi:MAG: O-antigen ligase family protein [Parvularculaceae bacterium]|nr:O-antigen ligase family protein [Parvularculaceae bacterium]
MSETFDFEPDFSARRAAGAAGLALGVGLYAALAAASTIIYPPLGLAFLAPLALGVVAVAPAGKASPRRVVMGLILVGVFLLPVWPVYLFIKFGPAPILTPPRLVFYAVSAFFLYDMVFSRWRRAQFLFAVRKSGAVSAFVFLFFLIGFMSLPFAEGRSIAIPEFFRQAIIWLLPYCAVLTYSRRQRDFVAIMKVFATGAFLVALVAIGETTSHKLLANILSPFISDNAEWLRIAQSEKIRDGAFRAQASHTHPISLGEHLAFISPFAFAFLVSAKKNRARIFWAAAFIAIVAGAVATNSRGSMLVTALGSATMIALLGWRFLKRASASRWRPFAGLICLLCILASPIAAIGAYGVISGASGVSAANSTQSRIDQVEQAWPKILKRPVGGYGAGRSTRVLGYWGLTLTIDNYYLSLALDYGFPGPIIFLGFLTAFAATALSRARRCHPSMTAIYFAAFAAPASIAIARLITSQTGNLAMIFVMAAAFAGASVTFSRRRSRNRV